MHNRRIIHVYIPIYITHQRYLFYTRPRKHPPPAKRRPSKLPATRFHPLGFIRAFARVRTARLVAPALASLDVRRFKHSQTLPTHDGGQGPGEAQARGEETGGEEETSGEEEARGEEDDGDEEEGGAEEEAGGCVYVTRR